MPLVAGFVAMWAAVNVPILIADLAADGRIDGWLGVFLFHARRMPDFWTIWYWWPSATAGSARLGALHWMPAIALSVGALVAGALPSVQSSRSAAAAPIDAGRGRVLALAAVTAAAIAWWVTLSPAMATGPVSVPYKALVDRVSFCVFALGSVGLWGYQWRYDRDPWAIGGATVALFLLVAKVYSPQYALWLAPFLVAVTFPVWLGLVYFVADVWLVYSGMQWYGASPHLAPHPWQTVFVATTFLRALLLVVMIVWFATAGRDATRDPAEAARLSPAGA